MSNACFAMGALAAAAILAVQPARASFDDLRWNKYPKVANAVDDFMRCTRAAKPGDLGKRTQDQELRMGWPPYMFCGAVVQWDARKAHDLKVCLLQRSFGEEITQAPSRKHRDGTTYSVAYDCGGMGLNLEVEVFGGQAKVVRMQDFDYP